MILKNLKSLGSNTSFIPRSPKGMNEEKDVFGAALWDYHCTPGDQELITWTSLTENDPVPIGYFFRNFDQMPSIEQKAMELSQGKILDVGCGAGSHGLYLQNQKKLEVTGIDKSAGAIKTAHNRGIQRLHQQSIFEFQGDTFDTLLLLMNGPGICGRLDQLPHLLEKLKTLIRPQGQILLDSSDLIYLFDENSAGEKIIPANHYYGELEYGIRYRGKQEMFPWLYVGYDLLHHHAAQIGLYAERVMEGENWDYLARLTMEY